MSGPKDVLDMVHRMGPRDFVVLAMIEGLRDQSRQSTPAMVSRLIKGSTPAKVAQVTDFLVRVGAAERLDTELAVTPAGVAAIKFQQNDYLPSKKEEKRRGRTIAVPGVDGELPGKEIRL